MKPREECNGAVAEVGSGVMSGGSVGSVGSAGSGSEEESDAEELSLCDTGAAARSLAALNALRKARQHWDVLLAAADKGEVPAHRALLAAASPLLLRALAPRPEAEEPAHRVPVELAPLRALVEYVYTGVLPVRDAAEARRLCAAAAALRMEAPRAHLAERLVRRLAPHDVLLVRALPALAQDHLDTIDKYIAEHFDEISECGALGTLPLVCIEMLRDTSAEGGQESPGAVAAAALAWLTDHHHTATLEELCARSHLVYVDAGGALRDCEQLPAASGDAPELHEYRAAAALRVAPEPRTGAQRGGGAVLAARREAGGATRALLVLGGRVAAARVSWRALAGGRRGGRLGGAEAGEARAGVGGGRAAGAGAALGGRLVVCGGYDRARVHGAARVYDARLNTWLPLPDMLRARARLCAAALGRKLYVLGGSDGHNELDTVDVLEEVEPRPPGAEEWSVSAWRWRLAGRLPAGGVSQAAGAGHAQGGALYVLGGWAGGRALRKVHKYLPAEGTWHEAPPLITARSQAASVVWGDSLWALGGCDTWHCLTSTEVLSLSEPGAVWQPGPALPTARRSVGGAEWRGRLVSAGGSDGTASLRRVDLLPPGAPAWAPGPPLRRPRAAPALVDLAGVLYAVGGFDGKEFLGCMECLYTEEGPWTTLCCPPAPPLPPAPLTPPASSPTDPTTPSKEPTAEADHEEGTMETGRANGSVPAQ